MLISSSIYAQKLDTVNKLELLIRDKIEKQKLGVGASVAIVENGEAKTFTIGRQSNNDKLMVAAKDLFEIGSISKVFTSIALADMVIEGKVKLDDPIQMYLPKEVKVPSKSGKQITLKHLATHDSGLPRLPSNLDAVNSSQPYAAYDQASLYAFLNEHELSRAPEVQREYSNLGVGLLGHLLGLIDGTSYQSVIEQRVLKPMGLDSTFVHLPKSKQASLIQGHNSQLVPVEHWRFDALAGAGSITSNILDMSSFLSVNMSKAKPVEDPKQEKRISKAVHLAQQIQTDFGNPVTNIGLGWIISSFSLGEEAGKARSSSGEYIWHNGGTAGFRSFLGFNNKTQKGIVILANTAVDLESIARAYLMGNIDTQVERLTRTPLNIPEEKLSKLNGEYQLMPGFNLTVTNEGDRLFIQATNQPKFPVFPNSATEFYYKVVEAKVVFELGEGGIANSVILHQNGRQMKGKKVN
ncbi:MAG: serine hydrolase [Kangiellaceae bacterium]|nr:serine hydrolase [Kangiellaceae bacterium]MCW9000914.1 serine hydrolase [Kangiellaceae bacterium]